jgi:phage tail-like protein
MDYTESNATLTDAWPMAKFFFEVTIDGLPALGFQTVEGLESETSVIEYRSGNSQFLFKSARPGMVSYSNLTLKKGAFLGQPDLKDLYRFFAWEIADNRTKRKEILVEMKNEAGEVEVVWTIKGAFPVKYTPPSLDAEADAEPAVEEMEFKYESFDMEWM